jgi:hypothetical protein
MEKHDMKLLRAEHECRPMRIHDLVADFTLEDVWALPTRGGPEDFEDLLDLVGSFDPSTTESRPARFLWNLRNRLGAWFDLGEISTPAGEQGAGELPIPGTAEISLLDRLPPDLRGTAAGFDFGSLPFVPLYRTEREAAAEISNKTVHGVAHLAWVERGDGRYEGRMAVYVKPRGAFGRAYMSLIKPFRYWVVYPALMGQVERAWETRPKGCVRSVGAGRLALEVVDAVAAAEEGPQAAAPRQALADPDLVGVGIDDDVGAAVAGDREEGRRLLAVVEDLVGALRAEPEAQRLALLQLADPLGRAQRGAAGEDDHELLVGVVEVVRVGGLAGRHLPEAGADQLGAELVADPRPPRPESLRPLPLLELGPEDVRHCGSL